MTKTTSCNFNYGLIESLSELKFLVDKLIKENIPVGLDIETGYDGQDRKDAAKHPQEAFIVGISFTNSTDWARYIPLRHDDIGYNFDNEAVATILWPLLKTGLIVAHNASFELSFLVPWLDEYLGTDECHKFLVRSDTMIEVALLSEFKGNGLKDQVLNTFNHAMTHFIDLFPGAANGKSSFLRFNVLGLTPQVVDYACEDALWALALHYRNYDSIKENFIFKLEMEVLYIVVEMEKYGLLFDWKFMREVSERAKEFMEIQYEDVQKTFSEMLGEPISINLASPKQVSDVLYNRLGFVTTRFTKGSQDSEDPKMSTDTVALEGLAQQHEVVRKLLEYREVKKLVGSYLDKYERDFGYDVEREGFTHPSHNQVFVISGRFSVSKPGYQQLPAGNHETEEGKKVTRYECAGKSFEFCFRDAVITPEGYYGIGFDYSQAELRAIAGEANETALIEAFERGEDIHIKVASMMFGISSEKVDKTTRGKGKAQPLDSSVLTPSGFRRFGDLKVGDLVIGSDGRAISVTGVYPQGMKDCYKLTTSDGETECCDEHLWTVKNKNTHNAKWQTKTLRELMDSGLMQKSKGSEYGQAKYELPVRPIVQFENQGELPIDPYVLGLLLGDGSFRTTSPMFCSADQELLDEVILRHEKEGGSHHLIERRPGFWHVLLGWNGKRNQLKKRLQDLGLWGKIGHDKFIPQAYLLATPEDRLEMLRGLLDTDGNVLASGAQFRTTSNALAEGVQFLVRSLGGFASFSDVVKIPGEGFNSDNPRPAYQVYCRIPGERLFNLTRKAEKQKKATRALSLHIKSAVYIGQKEMQCISVSSEDSLYVTDSILVTHNTLNFALAYNMGVKSLAERLGISLEEAQDLYDLYFETFPNIKKLVQEKMGLGGKYHYSLTKFGRKMTIWEYDDPKPYIRNKADRIAFNTVIQGSATGDVTKIAMVRADKAIKAAGLQDRMRLVMNIHDALEFYVHNSVPLDTAVRVLEPAVLFPVQGWPSMVADWHTWTRWGSAQEVHKNASGEWVVEEPKVIEEEGYKTCAY
jgi:DNA polymerase I-like protein with 3'-5' exonuclease and polymerase domains